MFGKNKKWFTLVELIVTITILAILWTIAALSFNQYTSQARDTVRLSDLKTMESALEYYALENSSYPKPHNAKEITYSWAILWYEWTFWFQTIAELNTVSKPPRDPLTENEYTFSKTNIGNEYEIWILLENEKEDNSSLIVKKTYAWKDTLRTYITWNYNWKIIKTSTWWTDYIITSPSLITSDTENRNYEISEIFDNLKLAYFNFWNQPSSYSWVVLNNDFQNKFDFSNWDNLVFEWTFAELYSDKKKKLELYQKISDRYNNSDLEWKKWFESFQDTYSDNLNPTEEYINYTCFAVWDLLNDASSVSNCVEDSEDILQWEAYTWALLPNWDTNYIWQWPLWDVNYKWQWIQTSSHERSSLGLEWWLNKTIWVKWKLFTKNKTPDTYYGWGDYNWDWNTNFIYWFWWKLIMWDSVTKNKIWETKTLNIKKVLWVEDIMWDWTKSIIVSLWENWYIWVINWATGELDWISYSANWPVKEVKEWWPSLNYKIFDIDNDWINEYHFKRRYKKYNSFKFFKNNWKVIWETLWASEWYWNYNEWSDWYQPSVWSMGSINNKLVVWAKWSNTFSFYSNDVDDTKSWTEKFQMPSFRKLNVWWNTWNWRSRSIWYFYDINNDWEDEYIARIDKELNNSKNSRIIVSWLDSSWDMQQFMSIATVNLTDTEYHKPIALKNSNNSEDSYILTKWEDPVSWIVKWMMLKYNWLSTSWYKKDSAENELFNYDIKYDIFDDSYDVSWIFNNWTKDYIVLRKNSKYYFYTFTWENTFSTPSTIEISWSFFGNTLFDDWYDIFTEKNSDSWVFMASYDTTWNWKKEFVVSNSWNFYFYEVEDSWVTLVKTLTSYSSIPSVKKWGLKENKKDVYAVTYNSSNNTVNYYQTDVENLDYQFKKSTNDTFYAGWQTNDMTISKLWKDSDYYNRLMVSWVWMFDARNASPTTNPTKLSNNFYHSYDMDKDWENEIFKYDSSTKTYKAYTYNWVDNHTLKYDIAATVWDFNWDWVMDYTSWYCTSNNLYLTVQNWTDKSEIIPDIDWWSWNWWCSWWGQFNYVSEDFNNDWKDDFVVWTAARKTYVLSLSWSIEDWFSTIKWGEYPTRNSSYNLVWFDFDWDWVKEVVRWHDDYLYIYKIDATDKTKLNLLANTTWRQVETTWGIDLWVASYFKSGTTTYIAVKWLNWEIALYSRDASNWLKFLFKNYYLYTQMYTSKDSILSNNLMPTPSADVILWDFMHKWEPQILMWGWDWIVYIIWLDWEIIRAFDIWTSIKRMIVWDTNDDLLIDILVWSEDWYIYQISSARLDPPSRVRDWLSSDTNSQDENNKSSLNFNSVENAEWYYIQIYNNTKKSIVFDQIDIWNKTSACVVSSDYVWDVWDCIQLSKPFLLEHNSIYKWKVQAYSTEMSSPSAISNWFYIK